MELPTCIIVGVASADARQDNQARKCNDRCVTDLTCFDSIESVSGFRFRSIVPIRSLRRLTPARVPGIDSVVMTTAPRATPSTFDVGKALRLNSLAVVAAISLILLLLGGSLTYLGLGPWYYRLGFPPFQPPFWLFTPAWLVVLSLLTPF